MDEDAFIGLVRERRPTWVNARTRLELPAGWEARFHLLCDMIAEALGDRAADFRIIQAKEKFAGGRVYWEMAGAPLDPWQRQVVRELVAEAERDMAALCQDCGAPATTCKRDGCYAALCPAHCEQGGFTPLRRPHG